MKQRTYLLAIAFIFLYFFICTAQNINETEHNKTTYSSKNRGCEPIAYQYGDHWTNFSPGTFNATTLVYESTELNAKIIDTLPFNTSVNILAEYPDYFLVCTQNRESGYVNKKEIYLQSIFWGLKMRTYLFGISAYGTNDETSCDNSKLQVIKINDKKEILNVYQDSIYGKDYSINQIHNSALKNSEALFHLSYHCYSGIGVEVNNFIVDNGEQLSRLVLTSGSGDGGIFDQSIVYLPLTLTNGKKIILAKNGVLSINQITAEPEIFPYPKDLKIPIEELIVVQDISEEYIGGYKTDGTMARDIVTHATTFYQWNGTTLLKIKTLKGY